jgi:hypothetical protein
MFDFLRDPLTLMRTYRDRADRAAIRYLEREAISGKITRSMVEKVAEAVNRDPTTLVRMVPDRRRERRYLRAMTGLRKAGLDVGLED